MRLIGFRLHDLAVTERFEVNTKDSGDVARLGVPLGDQRAQCNAFPVPSNLSGRSIGHPLYQFSEAVEIAGFKLRPAGKTRRPCRVRR